MLSLRRKKKCNSIGSNDNNNNNDISNNITSPNVKNSKICVEKKCEYIGSLKVNVLRGVHYKDYIHDQVSNCFKNVQFGLRVLLLVSDKGVKTFKDYVEKMTHCVVNISFASYLNHPKLFVYVAKGYSTNCTRITQAHVYKMRCTKDSKEISSALQRVMEMIVDDNRTTEAENKYTDHSFTYGNSSKHRNQKPSVTERDIADHVIHSEEKKCGENSLVNQQVAVLESNGKSPKSVCLSPIAKQNGDFHWNSKSHKSLPLTSIAKQNGMLPSNEKISPQNIRLQDVSTITGNLKVVDAYYDWADLQEWTAKDILSEYVILDDNGSEVKYREQLNSNTTTSNNNSMENKSINNKSNSSNSNANNVKNITNINNSINSINSNSESSIQTQSSDRTKEGNHHDQQQLLSDFSWYQPRILPTTAHALLASKPVGSFYLRHGKSPQTPYALSLKYKTSGVGNQNINDYCIFYHDDRYRIEGCELSFSSVLQLIEYYTCEWTDDDGRDQLDHGVFPLHRRLSNENDSSSSVVWSDEEDEYTRYESSLDLMRELRIYREQFSTFVFLFSCLLHQVLVVT